MTSRLKSMMKILLIINNDKIKELHRLRRCHLRDNNRRYLLDSFNKIQPKHFQILNPLSQNKFNNTKSLKQQSNTNKNSQLRMLLKNQVILKVTQCHINRVKILKMIRVSKEIR